MSVASSLLVIRKLEHIINWKQDCLDNLVTQIQQYLANY